MDNSGDTGEKIDLLLALGKFREAETMAAEAVGRDPQWAAGYGGLARAYAGLGDLDKALEAARDGVRYAPNDARPHDILGFVYARRGEYPFALAANGEALRLDPQWAGVYAMRATIHNAMGKPASALAAADAGLRLDPGMWQLLKECAWALYNLDRLDDAMACATDALARDPLQPELHNLVGCLYLESGRRGDFPWAFRDFAAAEVAFREALRLNPTEPSYQANRRDNSLASARLATKPWIIAQLFLSIGYAAPVVVLSGNMGCLAVAFGMFASVAGFVGLQRESVLFTMPRFGLPVVCLPLSPQQSIAGRIYWALFALAVITPIVALACWLIIRLR